jgi:hypothetical protein
MWCVSVCEGCGFVWGIGKLAFYANCALHQTILSTNDKKKKKQGKKTKT